MTDVYVETPYFDRSADNFYAELLVFTPHEPITRFTLDVGGRNYALKWWVNWIQDYSSLQQGDYISIDGKPVIETLPVKSGVVVMPFDTWWAGFYLQQQIAMHGSGEGMPDVAFLTQAKRRFASGLQSYLDFAKAQSRAYLQQRNAVAEAIWQRLRANLVDASFVPVNAFERLARSLEGVV